MGGSNADSEAQEPFLGAAERDVGPALISQRPGKFWWLLLAIASISIATNLAFLLLWTSFKMGPADLPNSPKLYNVLTTKVELWPEDAWDNSIYVGKPSKELDTAWDKLQAVEGISVSPEEAVMINLTSNIKLKNGDQAVVVGYFHNLHCIRYLYQGLHPEIYHREDGSGHAGLGHSYHCLEVLRRSILCQPDLTLHAIHWQTEEKLGMTLQPESARECIDFNAVYDFAMTRRFPRNMIIGVENSVYDS